MNQSGGTFHITVIAGSEFFNGGTFTNMGDIVYDSNGNSNFAPIFVNSGRFEIASGGLFLNSGTTVNSGVLSLLNNATLAVTSGTFSNTVSGSITGSGTLNVVSTSFTNSGTLSPGSSAGELTIFGDVTFDANSVVLIELEGLTQGTEYDLVSISGTANLDGTLRVLETGGFETTAGDDFTVMTYGGRTGNFATLEPSFGDTYSSPVEGAAEVTLSVTDTGNTISWDGGAGTLNWTDAANWSGDVLPGPADNAFIDSASGSVTLSSSSQSIRGLGIADGQELILGVGGVLDVASSSLVSGSTGMLTLQGGTLQGTGSVSVNGTLNWESGTISVSNLTTSGTVNLNTGGTKVLTSRWESSGTANFNDGIVDLSGTASFLENTGTFTITTTDSADTIQGSGTFVNEIGGMLVKSAAGTMILQMGDFINIGTVDVDNGVLDFSVSSTSFGLYDLDLTGVISFSGGIHNIEANTPIAGFSQGTLLVNGGTVFLREPLMAFRSGAVALNSGVIDVQENATIETTFTMTGGIVEGARDLLVNMFDWSGGTISVDNLTTVGTTDLNGAGTKTLTHRWTNNGTINFNDGTLDITGVFGALDNDGTLSIATTDSADMIVGSGVLNNNAGAMLEKAGTGTITIAPSFFNNAGITDVDSGILAFTVSTVTTGTFDIDSGASIAFTAGSHDINTASPVTSSSAGTFLVNGGTVLFNSSATPS